MRLNRFLPLFVPLGIFFFLELFYFFPNFFYQAIIYGSLLFLFASRQLILEAKKEEHFYNIIIMPLFLFLSVIVFSAMIPLGNFWGKVFLQFVFIGTLVLLNIYYKYLFLYLLDFVKYKKKSLENYSFYSSFIIVFLSVSATFGLQSFLNVSSFLLMLFVVSVFFVLIYQILWVNGVLQKNIYFYILLACLLLYEITWSVSFLTLSYYVLGLLVAISYYVIVGIIRFYLLNILNKKILKTYLGLGFVGIIIILLSARWI